MLLIWLKSVMEWLYGILFMMYGSSVFSSDFAIREVIWVCMMCLCSNSNKYVSFWTLRIPYYFYKVYSLCVCVATKITYDVDVKIGTGITYFALSAANNDI